MCCGYESRPRSAFKDRSLENCGRKNREDKIYKKFRVADSVIFEFERLEKTEKKIIFCAVTKKKNSYQHVCIIIQLLCAVEAPVRHVTK